MICTSSQQQMVILFGFSVYIQFLLDSVYTDMTKNFVFYIVIESIENLNVEDKYEIII